MSKLTLKWLKNKKACTEAVEWFKSQNETDEFVLLKKCIKENHLEWANWAMARRLSKYNRVKYAIYAAKQVLKIFEDKYPNNDSPRQAIKAAEAYLKNPCIKTRIAAANAAKAAYAAYAIVKLKIKILKYGATLLKQGG